MSKPNYILTYCIVFGSYFQTFSKETNAHYLQCAIVFNTADFLSYRLDMLHSIRIIKVNYCCVVGKILRNMSCVMIYVTLEQINSKNKNLHDIFEYSGRCRTYKQGELLIISESDGSDQRSI